MASYDVMDTIKQYYRNTAVRIAAHAYLEQKKSVQEAVYQLRNRINSCSGETPEIRAKNLNATHLFYIESILREAEWLSELAEKMPEEDSTADLKDRKLTRLGKVARPYLEGLRFLDDFEQGRIKGHYGCHDLAVLIDAARPWPYPKRDLPDALCESARALLSEHIPAGQKNQAYADFIRKKTNLEKQIAEAVR